MMCGILARGEYDCQKRSRKIKESSLNMVSKSFDASASAGLMWVN
jgi:hypothetical protein